jgi:hypothetical protein
VGNFLGLKSIATMDDDNSPLAREGLGDGLTNPLAAAGDKGLFSVQLQIHDNP